jgi:site-specific recombinase XerD
LRKIRQLPPTEGEDRLIPFLASLVAEDLSPNTVDGYRRDLLAFRRWYREARGTDLRWEKLGSNDLINYRQHLVSVERRRPATVNRRLHPPLPPRGRRAAAGPAPVEPRRVAA